MEMVRTAKGVALFTSPWVQGTRAASYMGPITASAAFFAPRKPNPIYVYWLLRVKAQALGANAVVGVETSINPFYRRGSRSGALIEAVGTAAKLERLIAA